MKSRHPVCFLAIINCVSSSFTKFRCINSEHLGSDPQRMQHSGKLRHLLQRLCGHNLRHLCIVSTKFFLHLLAWVLSGYIRIYPQSKYTHIRLIGNSNIGIVVSCLNMKLSVVLASTDLSRLLAKKRAEGNITQYKTSKHTRWQRRQKKKWNLPQCSGDDEDDNGNDNTT